MTKTGWVRGFPIPSLHSERPASVSGDFSFDGLAAGKLDPDVGLIGGRQAATENDPPQAKQRNDHTSKNEGEGGIATRLVAVGLI